MDAAAIASAMGRMLDDPSAMAALAAQARMRRFPTWNDYANELVVWMRELPRRD